MSPYPYAATAALIACPFRRARFAQLAHMLKQKDAHEVLALALRHRPLP